MSTYIFTVGHYH